VAQSAPSGSIFDFTGVDAFWAVVDVLEADESPSDEQWSTLLRSPGYRALTVSEFTEDFFIQNFSLAYMPSKREALDEVLATGDDRFLQHYVEVGERRAELARQAEYLKTASVASEALALTRNFLPAGVTSERPSVALVIFANDGRGYDPIVIDLLASISWDFQPFLAHEFHHWYRNRLVGRTFREASPAEDLLQALHQLHAEGVADQIDKRPWMIDGSRVPNSLAGYASRFRAGVEAAPEMIRTLDAHLARYGGDEATRRVMAREIRDLLPMSGHPTGYFMVGVILDELGPERVIRDVSNPFAFVRAFNEAAAGGGHEEWAISPASMSVLDSIEREYERRRE